LATLDDLVRTATGFLAGVGIGQEGQRLLIQIFRMSHLEPSSSACQVFHHGCEIPGVRTKTHRHLRERWLDHAVPSWSFYQAPANKSEGSGLVEGCKLAESVEQEDLNIGT
jgi:hypothetical protein